MNNLQVFNNHQFGEIRVLEMSGEPWFVAKDISNVLGYTDAEAMTRRLDNDEQTLISKQNLQDVGFEIPTRGLKMINESGLYSAVLGSQKEEAKHFKRWVTREVLPTIRKTGGYVNNDDLFVETYFPFMDDTTKQAFKQTLETVRKQNELIISQQKEIQHKEDVIIGLIDEVTLADKRQVLNRVVRYKGANFQDRWKELYRQFEMKYHIDLNKRFETYNKENKPKIKNKIDYIDKVMGKVADLYEIACKLYENDVKELAQEIYSLN